MRPAQHLDAPHIDKIQRGGCNTGDEQAVHIKADALFDAVICQPEQRADPADVDRGVARIGREKLHAGLNLLQPGDVERALPFVRGQEVLGSRDLGL